jgi:hypothetical protein
MALELPTEWRNPEGELGFRVRQKQAPERLHAKYRWGMPHFLELRAMPMRTGFWTMKANQCFALASKTEGSGVELSARGSKQTRKARIAPKLAR